MRPDDRNFELEEREDPWYLYQRCLALVSVGQLAEALTALRCAEHEFGQQPGHFDDAALAAADQG